MKLHVKASGFELGSELDKYANGKATQLNKEIPRQLRAGANCEINFTQVQHKTVKVSTCTVVLQMQDTEFRAEESTQHMYAALDIATVSIEHQLTDYLSRHPRLKRSGSEWQVP